MSISTAPGPATSAPDLPIFWLNLMRVGQACMAAGLVMVTWPLLSDARTFPLYEGGVVCMLTAMSLLWLVELRYPVKLIRSCSSSRRGRSSGSPSSRCPAAAPEM